MAFLQDGLAMHQGGASAGALLNQPSSQFKVGFIGAGQMAEAMARSWHMSGVVPSSAMFCTDVSVERRRVFESFGVTCVDTARQVAERSDVIILAVKPPGVRPVLLDLRSVLEDRHLIVSIAAGVTINSMHAWAGQHVRFVRVMPNTACLVGAAASAISAGPRATPSDTALVRGLFSAVGIVHEVAETALDAVTGLSGTGPAYVFMLIEAMADGGVAAGLPREMAISLAAQTAFGAAKMALETNKHPAQLKDAVASPAGTTIAGLHELEKGGFRACVMNAVIAATARSKVLSTTNSSIGPMPPDTSYTRPRKMAKVARYDGAHRQQQSPQQSQQPHHDQQQQQQQNSHNQRNGHNQTQNQNQQQQQQQQPLQLEKDADAQGTGQDHAGGDEGVGGGGSTMQQQQQQGMVLHEVSAGGEGGNEGDGYASGDFSGQMHDGSGGAHDPNRGRKSRVVVCKTCGGNHYKKTSCRGPPIQGGEYSTPPSMIPNMHGGMNTNVLGGGLSRPDLSSPSDMGGLSRPDLMTPDMGSGMGGMHMGHGMGGMMTPDLGRQLMAASGADMGRPDLT